MRTVDEFDQPRLRLVRLEVEPHDDTGGHFEAVPVQGVDCLEHWQGGVMSLVDSRQNLRLGRLDFDENCEEAGFPHEHENIDLLCDVQRRLTGELQRISPPLLPVDQMRKEVARRLSVPEEIVVDEIDHRWVIRLGDESIELGKKLFGRLAARLGAQGGRDGGEFASTW